MANWTRRAVQKQERIASRSATKACEIFLKVDAVDRNGFRWERQLGILNHEYFGYLVTASNAHEYPILMFHRQSSFDENWVVDIGQPTSKTNDELLRSIASVMNINVTDWNIFP